MAGTLYVVATPIGNLEDITLRALRVLREVAVVAAEDTRRTGHLLRHFQIATRLISIREHNERRQSVSVVERLRRGESVALVTDAGTPAVSDPGAEVVRAVVDAGLRVEPVPGPSAVMAALSAAGVSGESFAFLGFPPSRGNTRKSWFEALGRWRTLGTTVFFEAPHRIVQALEALENLAIDQIVVFRELTKVHETAYRGTPREVRQALSPVAGEFTLVLPALAVGATAEVQATDADVLSLFGEIAETSGRRAAKIISARTGRSTNDVYDLIRRRKA